MCVPVVSSYSSLNKNRVHTLSKSISEIKLRRLYYEHTAILPLLTLNEMLGYIKKFNLSLIWCQYYCRYSGGWYRSLHLQFVRIVPKSVKRKSIITFVDITSLALVVGCSLSVAVVRCTTFKFDLSVVRMTLLDVISCHISFGHRRCTILADVLFVAVYKDHRIIWISLLFYVWARKLIWTITNHSKLR